MRICLLASPKRFLPLAAELVPLAGLTHISGTLTKALAGVPPVALIIASPHCRAFLDYLDRRQTDRRLARIPLLLISDSPVNDATPGYAAFDIIPNSPFSLATAEPVIRRALAAGPPAWPRPPRPFRHQRLDPDSYKLLSSHVALPKLDEYCRRAPTDRPTPYAALTIGPPLALLDLLEIPDFQTCPGSSHIVNLSRPPETALLAASPRSHPDSLLHFFRP